MKKRKKTPRTQNWTCCASLDHHHSAESERTGGGRGTKMAVAGRRRTAEESPLSLYLSLLLSSTLVGGRERWCALGHVQGSWAWPWCPWTLGQPCRRPGQRPRPCRRCPATRGQPSAGPGSRRPICPMASASLLCSASVLGFLHSKYTGATYTLLAREPIFFSFRKKREKKLWFLNSWLEK